MKKIFLFFGIISTVITPFVATSCYSTHLIRHENFYSLEEAYKNYTIGDSPRETQEKNSHGAYESKWIYIRNVKGEAAPVKFKILSTQHVEGYMISCMEQLLKTHKNELIKVISILLPKETYEKYKVKLNLPYEDIVKINVELIPEHNIEWNYTIEYENGSSYKFLYNLSDGIKNIVGLDKIV